MRSINAHNFIRMKALIKYYDGLKPEDVKGKQVLVNGEPMISTPTIYVRQSTTATGSVLIEFAKQPRDGFTKQVGNGK